MTRRATRDGIRILPTAILAALAALFPPATPAQDAQPAATPQYTLHAYANLVQIPVLVLSSTRTRLRQPVPPTRFQVRIDSGPWFRPTHVRLEGDDPIALSILLDTHGNSAQLLPQIAGQLAALTPEELHASDRVSLYTLDCTLERSLHDLPTTPELLKRGTEAALLSWKTRTATHARCPATAHLQEAIVYILKAMQNLPGRRVILVLSEGEDEIANPSWSQVAEIAQNAGTAIYAIAPDSVQVQQLRGMRTTGPQNTTPLNTLCELTGGTLLLSNSHQLSVQLRDFTRILRERYIVDFPRPANSTPGRHSLEVRIEKSGASFIRPSGISVPIADPALAADPTTVPSDPTLMPTQGTHSNLPQ